MKVAFLGGMSVPEGQVPLFLSAFAKNYHWNWAPSAHIDRWHASPKSLLSIIATQRQDELSNRHNGSPGTFLLRQRDGDTKLCLGYQYKGL